MEEVRVNLGERSYPIYIDQGLIARTGQLIRDRGLDGKVLVVTNPTVAKWYGEPLLRSLTGSGFTAELVMVPDGETTKSLEEASRLYDYLVTGKYDRHSLLLALGGGVIGDLAGFVAATYMRGVGFIQIPTTLLAQVDSSIGGKVAVNHPQGKNLIGSFYQPSLVIADVEALQTLPQRELTSGMAEVIKHGVILDENYFRFLSGELPQIRLADPQIMTWIVSGSCRIKAAIVAGDERESGSRALLNFGHTVGHALESVTHYTRFKHGEAIAVGMLAAIEIAAAMEILEEPDLGDRLAGVFTELGLPTNLTDLPTVPICEAIRMDKKAVSGQVRWILPRRLGEAVISGDVPEKLVKQVLQKMGGR